MKAQALRIYTFQRRNYRDPGLKAPVFQAGDEKPAARR